MVGLGWWGCLVVLGYEVTGGGGGEADVRDVGIGCVLGF